MECPHRISSPEINYHHSTVTRIAAPINATFIHQISSQSFLSILLKTPPKKIHNIDNPRHPSHHHNTFQSLSINQKKTTQTKPDHAFAFFSASPATMLSSSVNLKLMLLTQCLSSVGVGYPSPLNTCPKCPPQLAQTISVRSMPNEVSRCRLTAPGMQS